MNNVFIIGVGLIGGSIALRLRNSALVKNIYGYDINSENLKYSIENGIIDEHLNFEDGINKADVIFICVPVNHIIEILPKVLDKVKNQIVIDIGSTKNPMIECTTNHQRRGRYVATHPMWGREVSGPQSALVDSFTDKAVVICNKEESEKDVLEYTENVYRNFGMKIIYMDSKSHDKHVAYVSHISHITSFALANTVLNKEKEDEKIFDLASAGFESTVRLAKSNPDMWVPIFLQNKEYILDVLDEHIEQLTQFRKSIRKENENEIRLLINHANRVKKCLEPKKNKEASLQKYYELTRGLH